MVDHVKNCIFIRNIIFTGFNKKHICRETKDCFMYCVDNDRSAANLMPIIQQAIRSGTRILSDQWAAYNQIQALPGNYAHETVNHTYNFVNPNDPAVHTQTIESTWRSAKRRNKKQCGTHRQMLDSYMCEYMWRKRRNGRNPFNLILSDIAAYWPPA